MKEGTVEKNINMLRSKQAMVNRLQRQINMNEAKMQIL